MKVAKDSGLTIKNGKILFTDPELEGWAGDCDAYTSLAVALKLEKWSKMLRGKVVHLLGQKPGYNAKKAAKQWAATAVNPALN